MHFSKNIILNIAQAFLGTNSVEYNYFQHLTNPLLSKPSDNELNSINTDEITALYNFLNNNEVKVTNNMCEMYFRILLSDFFEDGTAEKNIWGALKNNLKEKLKNDTTFTTYENSRCGGLLTGREENTIRIDRLSISANRVSNLKYLASGSFGDVYQAEYTGKNESFRRQHCTKIGNNYYFVIKYAKVVDEEFIKEQQTVSALHQSQNPKENMNLSAGATIEYFNNNKPETLQTIISPLEVQKLSKLEMKMLSRDFTKFLTVKAGKNKNGENKLAEDEGILLLGVLWDMHAGLLSCHANGFLHLDNAPRNYLMGWTEYDQDNKPLAYHAKLADYGQSRKLVNGQVTDANRKMPILIASANRLYGEPLTVADDLYAYRLAFLEVIAMRLGHDLKFLYPKGQTRSYGEIAQWIMDQNNNETVLTTLFENALMIAQLKDNTEMISILESFKSYICSNPINDNNDKTKLEEAIYQFSANKQFTLSQKFNTHESDLREYELSLKRLKKLPQAIVPVLHVDPAILEAAKKADLVEAKKKFEKTKITIEAELKNIQNQISIFKTTTTKDTALPIFIKIIKLYEKMEAKQLSIGLGYLSTEDLNDLENLSDMSPQHKAIYNAYLAVKRKRNELELGDDFVYKHQQLHDATREFIQTLNTDIQENGDTWKDGTQHPSAELLSAYHDLVLSGGKISAELFIQYALEDEKNFVHPKILKHFNNTDFKKFEKNLAGNNTFYQRHPALSWAIIGGVTTLGLIGIGIAIAITHGGATPLLVPFAQGVTALASAVGISTAGASTTLLGSIGLGSSIAAVTGFFSGLSAGISAGVRKIARLFARDVTVAVPATRANASAANAGENDTPPKKTESKYLVEPHHTPPHAATTAADQGSTAILLAATDSSGYGNSYNAKNNDAKSKLTAEGYMPMPATQPMRIPHSMTRTATGYGSLTGGSAPTLSFFAADQGGYGDHGTKQSSSLNSQYSNLPGKSDANADENGYLRHPLGSKKLGNRNVPGGYVDLDKASDNGNDNNAGSRTPGSSPKNY